MDDANGRDLGVGDVSPAGGPAEPELPIGDELARRREAGDGRAVALALPGDARSGKLFAPRRGPGRPKGARNLRTEKVARELVERYGDPLEADVAIGAMPLGDLVTELRTIASDRGLKLGMTIGDVVKWQQSCRANALPYIHAKRATTDDKGDPVLPVIAFGRADNVQINAGGRSIEDFEEYQEVSELTSDEDGAKSHDGKSHDDATD